MKLINSDRVTGRNKSPVTLMTISLVIPDPYQTMATVGTHMDNMILHTSPHNVVSPESEKPKIATEQQPLIHHRLLKLLHISLVIH